MNFCDAKVFMYRMLSFFGKGVIFVIGSTSSIPLKFRRDATMSCVCTEILNSWNETGFSQCLLYSSQVRLSVDRKTPRCIYPFHEKTTQTSKKLILSSFFS